jgi:hypothetical protein
MALIESSRSNGCSSAILQAYRCKHSTRSSAVLIYRARHSSQYEDLDVQWLNLGWASQRSNDWRSGDYVRFETPNAMWIAYSQYIETGQSY